MDELLCPCLSLYTFVVPFPFLSLNQTWMEIPGQEEKLEGRLEDFLHSHAPIEEAAEAEKKGVDSKKVTSWLTIFFLVAG